MIHGDGVFITKAGEGRDAERGREARVAEPALRMALRQEIRGTTERT